MPQPTCRAGSLTRLLMRSLLRMDMKSLRHSTEVARTGTDAAAATKGTRAQVSGAAKVSGHGVPCVEGRLSLRNTSAQSSAKVNRGVGWCPQQRVARRAAALLHAPWDPPVELAAALAAGGALLAAPPASSAARSMMWLP